MEIVLLILGTYGLAYISSESLLVSNIREYFIKLLPNFAEAICCSRCHSFWWAIVLTFVLHQHWYLALAAFGGCILLRDLLEMNEIE